MLFLLLLSAVAAERAQAIVPPIPSPTDPVVDGEDLLGFTPKPTEAVGFPFDLRKRSGVTSGQFLGWFAPDNTCGYIDGSIGASKACASTQLCAALEYQNAATLGCCDTLNPACTWFGTCIDSIAFWSSSKCGQACQNDVNTVRCTNATAPYCYSLTIPTIGGTWYSCASTAYSQFVTFETTFAGENDGRTWNKAYASGSSTLPISPIAGSAGASTTPIGPAVTTASSESTPIIGPAVTTASSKSTPIGAVVGGVVGGIVFIGIAIAALLFLLLRRKPNKAAVVATAPDTTEQQATQSTYGAPAGFQSQPDPSAAGYYAGKQDYLTKFSGSKESKPPTSPTPAYSHPVRQQNTGIPAFGGPPPNVHYQFQQQQPMGGVPSVGMGVVPAGGHNVIQELPAQFATSMHYPAGGPIFEAPDQTYRSA